MSKRRKETNEFDAESHAGDMRKKNLALFISILIVIAGVGAASAYWLISGTGGGSIETTTSGGSGGTTTTKVHHVIGELFVTTTCPYCANAEDDLKNIENSRNDFYFVTFIADVNQDAYNRYTEVSKQQGTPDTEFDGGVKGELGAVDSSKYTSDIDYCKGRDVPDIRITGSAHSFSSGISYSVGVSVQSGSFSGHIRAFVIEKVSGYTNVKNKPIPNAFMGYALNQDMSVSSGSAYSKSGTWNGDVSDPSNMAIVVAVYDSNGHAVQAYRMNL